MTKRELESIHTAGDADIRAALAVVCIRGGAASLEVFVAVCNEHRNFAIEGKRDHWAGVYARLATLAKLARACAELPETV